MMGSGEFQRYWTGTDTYGALKLYIGRNFDGLKESITVMLGNGQCKIDPSTFRNDMMTFKMRDDVLTLLLYLGCLTFDKESSEVFMLIWRLLAIFGVDLVGALICSKYR